MLGSGLMIILFFRILASLFIISSLCAKAPMSLVYITMAGPSKVMFTISTCPDSISLTAFLVSRRTSSALMKSFPYWNFFLIFSTSSWEYLLKPCFLSIVARFIPSPDAESLFIAMLIPLTASSTPSSRLIFFL